MPGRDLCTRAGVCIALFLAFTSWWGRTACATTDDPSWWDDLTLVELGSGVDPVRAQRSVEEHGGRIALMLPHVLLGWIPPGLDATLRTDDGLAVIHRDAADLAPGLQADLGVRFFQRAKRGEFAPAALAGGAAGATPHMHFDTDAFDPGLISADAVRRNIEAQRLPPSKVSSAEVGSGPAAMAGRVAVTLFFIESDGSGGDPDQFDWSRGAEDDVIDAALAGCAWWSDQARQNDVSLAFQLDVHRATNDDRCAQWREPALHASTDVADAVADVLAHFGYKSGDHLARAAAHNAVQRTSLQADAAFCSFIIANPSGADAYADGRSAWAYYGGPYTTLMQRNFDWSFSRVFTHESAHIFGACDEYWEPGVGGCGTCGRCGDTGVDNGNCESCNPAPVPCMMRRNSWALCEYTPGQIGWWRDTPVHYVGPAGNPRFPFRTPGTAARDIDAALDVASPGDTIRLACAPIQRTVPLRINKTLVVEGGWDDSFNTRTPQSPTPIEASGAGPVILLEQPQTTVILESLHLRNGAGLPCAPPELGNVQAGGGLFCSGASTVLRDCIFESNVAGTTSTLGAGGGAFFWSADAVLERCTLRGNTAGRGGGIAFVTSHATLSNCSIHDNALDANRSGAGGIRQGAGMAAIASVVLVQDTDLDGNTDASIGGGIHAQQSQLDLIDVRLSDNHAIDAGGGLAAEDSDVDLRGCSVHANEAQVGGGLHADGGTLAAQSTWIAGNRATGLAGAGLLTHNVSKFTNVTVARNDGPAAGGLMLIDEQPGAVVRNCIIAYNSNAGLVHTTPDLPMGWNDLWGNDADATLENAGSDPRFVSVATLDLELGTHSPCIDAGDPSIADADGSRSDVGAFGGVWAHGGAPARMHDVTATADPAGVRLGWDQVPEGTDSVLVYRGATMTFQPSADTFVDMIPATLREYLDADAPSTSWYKLAPRSSNGAVGGYSDAVRAERPTAVEIHHVRHELFPVAPNPANPGAWIAFQIDADARVRVAIHDARGRRTRLLQDSPLPSGLHRMFWDGRDDHGQPAASGVYWVYLDAGGATRVRRFVVVR